MGFSGGREEQSKVRLRRNYDSARNWRIEERRAANIREEQRQYANVGQDCGSQKVRMDWWGVYFDGENDRNSVGDFMLRVDFLQRQYHVLLKRRDQDRYWVHVRH